MTHNNQKQVFKGGWEELENAIHTTNKAAFPVSPKAFFIKPDGTKIFITFGGNVEVYPLSIPWDPSTLGTLEATFVVPAEFIIAGLYFKDDGAKMYTGDIVSKVLLEFVLPIPWDIESIVDPPVTMSLSPLVLNPIQIAFSRDGDFTFVTDAKCLFSFPLPILWDITSNTTNTLFAPVGITEISVIFKPQGDKMYIGDAATNTIKEYDLSPVYDITTSVLSGNSLTLSGNPNDIMIKSNGMEFFILIIAANDIIKFHLDEEWNISTASHFTNTFTTGVTDAGIFWKPDGTKFFTIDFFADTIVEHSAITRWNLTGVTTGSSFSIATLDTNVQSMWWRKDGLRCYIAGINTDRVYQLNVSTAWDVSTMSDSGISVSIIDVDFPAGLYFRADGLKFYVIDIFTEKIFEYDMSSFFDLVSATLLQFSIIPVITNVSGMCFKPDGLIVYIGSITNSEIRRYSLSIPWDISILIFQDLFNVAAQETGLRAIFIREDDGKKLYITGDASEIFSYDLSLDFDNSIITTLGEELVTNLEETLVYA